jgi:MobC-like protein
MKKGNKNCRVWFALTEEELAELDQKYKATTCRSMSDYVRARLFEGSVTVLYRDQSLDDFLPIAGNIRDQLEGIRRNRANLLKTLRETAATDDLTALVNVLLSEEFSFKESLLYFKSVFINFFEDARRSQHLRGDEGSH